MIEKSWNFHTVVTLHCSFWITFEKRFTVWKREKLVHTNEIFREINFVDFTFLSRNFCQNTVNFLNFHTVAFPTLIVFYQIYLKVFFWIGWQHSILSYDWMVIHGSGQVGNFSIRWCFEIVQTMSFRWIRRGNSNSIY